jgi:Zn-dependent membrane protease YugP
MELYLFLVAFLIVIIAQINVTQSYNKYSKIESSNNLTGADVARAILKKQGLDNIYVVETKGRLTDHYDPRRKVIRLSSEVYHETSIASLAVAAHETGHAIQHKRKYVFLGLRSIVYPLAAIGSNLGYFVIFMGLLTGVLNIFYFGILLISMVLLFQLVTLPVEFNASRVAREELINMNLITKGEEIGVQKMLNAAALTYVTAAIASFLNILRLILLARDRD